MRVTEKQKVSKMFRWKTVAGIGFVLVCAIAIANRGYLRKIIGQLPFMHRVLQRKTVEEQIQQYGVVARQRLKTLFESKGIHYPPERTSFVAIKDTRELQVYVLGGGSKFQFVRSYPILGASGKSGPKLREGDEQVPEGIYAIQSLEPNTPFHLGLRVNYPNAFDLAHAQEDGRANPGGDILLHGSNCSIGCIAMGDEASEDLFVLAYDTKDKKVPLIICPVDLRSDSAPEQKPTDPSWLPTLYDSIQKALVEYPIPPKSG